MIAGGDRPAGTGRARSTSGAATSRSPSSTCSPCSSAGATAAQQFIVLEVRLPRSLTGLLVGAALGRLRRDHADGRPQPPGQPGHPRRHLGRQRGRGAAIVVGAGAGRHRRRGPAPRAPSSAAWSPRRWSTGWPGARGSHGYRLVLVGIGIGAMADGADVLAAGRRPRSPTRRGRPCGSPAASTHRGWEHVVPVAVALAVLVPAGLLLSFTARHACSSATTPPAASACASTAPGPRCCSSAIGLCARGHRLRGPDRLRRARRARRSPAAGRHGPSPALRVGGLSALCSWSRPTSSPAPCSRRRAARRHHHRR